MGVKEREVRTVHFTIQGDWFTDFLRGLWVEGSEVYAVKSWIATFPNHASVESLKDYFIKVVSGKAKFEGDSDGDGFDLVEDNVKELHGIPLLDSWEDVLSIKKLRLYVAEMQLRRFRLTRKYPEIFCNNSFSWAMAVEENRIENTIRKDVNRYLTDIHNLSVTFDDHQRLPMLPEDEYPLLTGPTWRVRGATMEQKSREWETYLKCKSVYESAIKYIVPIDRYFKEKYGDNIITIDYDTVKELCGIDVESEDRQDHSMFEDFNQPGYDIRYLMEEMDIPKIIPQISVDEYINNAITESNRTDIRPEEASKTTWKSGYIDRNGKFYGCSDLGHVTFSEKLCEKFGLIDSEDDTSDTQQILDKAGWIKVSMNRFFWDCYKNPTQSQKDTIFDYMQGKGMTKALFNSVSGPQTLADAMEEWSR